MINIEQEIDICRSDQQNVISNRATLEALELEFKVAYGSGIRWAVINPNNDFHLTYNHTNYQNAHLTCRMPDGTMSHVSLARTKAEIAEWYFQCCNNLGDRRDYKFYSHVMDVLPFLRVNKHD